MKYLFEAWNALEERLRRKTYILLCMDFDGTIVPIKPRPKEANLGADARRVLQRISKTKFFIVGIISGRSLKDIKEKVGVKGLIFSGNHGLEIVYKNKNFVYPAAKKFIPVMFKIAQRLSMNLSSFPQAILEKKGLSLSLHYRLVKEGKLPRLKAIFLQSIKPYLAKDKVKLTFGKKVWEIRPPLEWNKGKAILWLVRKLKRKRMFTMYIGDDSTDEDAFKAVNKIGGVSILVGNKKSSQAKYYLKNTKDTQQFLRQMEKIK